MNWLNAVHFGDCRERMREMIAAGARVNCVVTSPPYWGLRSYLPGDSAQKANELGSERLHDCLGWATKNECGECHVCNIVDLFRLVRQVLADDGTAWVNYGDSYAGYWGAQGRQGETGEMAGRSVVSARQIAAAQRRASHTGSTKHLNGLKPKDLCMIPARVALALQADGWWVRQDIVWSKPNPMPESVNDRCTKAHEYIFLLSKRDRYFYDAEAILESVSPSTHARLSQDVQNQVGSTRANGGAKANGNMKAVARKFDPSAGNKNNPSFDEAMAIMPSLRNKRSVWTVTTKPYSGAHFATFPPALIEPMILAGTSAHGHCPQCGAGWVRIVEKGAPLEEQKKACGADSAGGYNGQAVKEYEGTGAQNARAVKARILEGMRERVTTGWRPTCKCGAEPVPGVVFDPFMGSGTTAEVAQRLGRNWIGTELNRDYEPLQRERVRQLGMAL